MKTAEVVADAHHERLKVKILQMPLALQSSH